MYIIIKHFRMIATAQNFVIFLW